MWDMWDELDWKRITRWEIQMVNYNRKQSFFFGIWLRFGIHPQLPLRPVLLTWL